MKTILHMTDICLPVTNTFIYDEVKCLKTYDYLFFCKEIANLDSFPIPKEKIITLPYYPLLKNKYYSENIFSKETALNILKPRIDFVLWKSFKKKLTPLLFYHNCINPWNSCNSKFLHVLLYLSCIRNFIQEKTFIFIDS